MDNKKDILGENIDAILAIGGKAIKPKTRTSKNMDESVRQRSQPMILRVTFPNGKVFCYNRALTTFTEVLRYIGPENVSTVGLEANRFPLVLKEVPEALKDTCEPLDNGWYANVKGSSTDIKYRQLLVINDKLELGLKIEISSDFGSAMKVQFGKPRKEQESLLVKFPDGTYIGEEKSIDTYRETIKKIGVDLIQRKSIELAGKQLVSFSKKYNNQEEIAPRQWLTIPSTTKDKARWLKSLSILLHIKIEVTTI